MSGHEWTRIEIEVGDEAANSEGSRPGEETEEQEISPGRVRRANPVDQRKDRNCDKEIFGCEDNELIEHRLDRRVRFHTRCHQVRECLGIDSRTELLALRP